MTIYHKGACLRRLSLLVPLACLLIAPTPSLSQCPDADGDLIPGSIIVPGKLEVNEAAALVGSCGLEVFMDGTTANRWVLDESPTNETVYRAAFRINVNDFNFNGFNSQTNRHILFASTARNGAGQNEAAIRLFIKRRGTRLLVSASAQNTAGDRSRHTPGVFLDFPATCPCADHLVEVEWQQATGPGIGDGIIRVRVDGGPFAERLGVKSVGQEIYNARLGAFTGVDVQSIGSYYLDEFSSFRTLAP